MMTSSYITLVKQFTISIQEQFNIQVGVIPIFELKILPIEFIKKTNDYQIQKKPHP